MWTTALVAPVALTALVAALLGLLFPAALAVAVGALVLLAGFAGAIAVAAPIDRHEASPLRLRVLVGFLHLAQPIARTWGQLTARVERVERSAEAWTGNRQHWVAALHRELTRRGCAVGYSEPTKRYDLRAHIGLLSSARITTAVLWNWQPVSRISIRMRWPSILTILGALTVVWSSGDRWPLVVVGVVVAATVVESLVLYRAVKQSITTTASGATV
jgi:hypothetical protein